MSSSKDNEKSILSQWAALKKATPEKKAPIDTDRVVHRASEGQQRLFFLDQLHPEHPVYNLTEIWHFQGELNVDLFLEALEQIGKGQEILRTTFHLEDSNIICRIRPHFKYDHEIIDLSGHDTDSLNDEFNRIARKKSNTHFNLSDGPLLNITICKIDQTLHRAIVNMHHIISDKWSMRILRNSLSAQYASALQHNFEPSPAREVQYADYVIHQLNQETNAKDVTYWHKKLQGFTEHSSFPSDKDMQADASLNGKYITRSFRPGMHASIKAFCKTHKVTSFVFFLSIYKLLLHKYAQQKDILVGTPVSTRSKIEFEKIIGFFNDTIVLRSQIDKNMTFLDHLTQVKKTVLAAFEHKSIGFQNLLNEINPNRSSDENPLFQTMFLYHNENESPIFGENLSINVQNYDMGVSKFDLTLYVAESPTSFEQTIEFATDLYTDQYVHALQNHIEELACRIIEHPSVQLESLHYLPSDEVNTLISIGKGKSLQLDRNENIIDAIFGNVNPDHIALRDQHQTITYEELNKRSNQIANALSHNTTENNIVGILLEQSTDFVSAMIGALKAGLAYVPLDVTYPLKHIRHILFKAEVQLVISSEKINTPEYGEFNVIEIEQIREAETFDHKDKIAPISTAYIMFTSGSTGDPNGVVVSHANLLNSTRARFSFYDDHPTSFLLLSPFSFDSSVAGIYWTLFNGGKLVIPAKRSIQDLQVISDLIEAEDISHTLLIPSLYRVFLELIEVRRLQKLKVVILAGEELPVSIAKTHVENLSGVRLYNEYGPTEATVWVCAYEVKNPSNRNRIPIGKAITNTTLLVLDENFHLCPKGIPGELFVHGASVSTGYLNTGTTEGSKFITTEVNNRSLKLYRTGDWVKWDEENNLLFLGRRDHQVKVRGHRIELGQVDAAIRALHKDLQSITIHLQDKQELRTFLVSTRSVNTEKLRAQIREQLPTHYHPDKIIQLESFPLMPNGKIDTKALQKFELNEENTINQPTRISSTERILLKIWQEVLQLPNLGVQDNFFEVGGDSIQIIRIVAKSKKAGIQLSPKHVYRHQNIATLCKHIVDEPKVEIAPLLWDRLPLTPIQSWYFDTHMANPHHWLQGYSFTLRQPVTLENISQAIRTLISHYEIFHVVFEQEYGSWFHRRKKFIAEDFIKPVKSASNDEINLNIQNGPLAHFILEETSGDVYGGKIIMHHLITDVLSWDVVFSFMEEFLQKNNDWIQSKNYEYFLWVNRLHQLASTNKFDVDIPFWKNMLEHNSTFFANVTTSIERDVITFFDSIDSNTTKTIQRRAKEVSGIKINEIVIAAFLSVFNKQTDERSLTLMLEHHGRNSTSTTVDLATSIGWHTTYFPINISLSDPASFLQIMLDVKDQLRSVPDNGLSYGVLKYISGKLSGNPNANVVINHLGDSDRQSSAVFEEVHFLRKNMRSDQSERDYLIEINSWIEGGEFKLAFSFDEKQLDPKMMQSFCDNIIVTIRNLPYELQGTSSIFTRSDFRFIYSQEDLSTIELSSRDRNVEITDLIELSANQSALLFHHLQPHAQDEGLIVATADISGQIDEELFQEAWHTVVSRHDALRSFFLWESLSKPVQVICNSVDSSVEFVVIDEKINRSLEDTVTSWVKFQDQSNLDIQQPPTHKIACFHGNGLNGKLIFVCHHIYIDGWSTNNLFEEFQHIYEALNKNLDHALPLVPRLSQWKQKFDVRRTDPAILKFWQNYLNESKATYLKARASSTLYKFKSYTTTLQVDESNRIRSGIKTSRITLNTLFAGVWSWLLSNYLNEPEVFIGLTHSGRSIDLSHMDALIGMFTTVLPLKFIRKDNSIIDLRAVQDDLNEILTMEDMSLEDISSTSQYGNLFDTVLIVENFVPKKSSPSALNFVNFKSRISSTIPLCLVVIPGDRIKLILRYNVNVYTADEVEKIALDFSSVLTKINISSNKASIDYQPVYSPLAEGNGPTETMQQLQVPVDSLDDGSTEQNLLRIWRGVLNNASVSLEDNFFEIGGTSLLAVQIFNKINEELGINASPILLLKFNTVQLLAENLAQDTVSESWKCLFSLKEGGNKIPLFCFHAGDGHIMFYKQLAESIESGRPVYGIQPVGLDGSDIQFGSIVEMANYYIGEIKKEFPTGPYHLLGTCFSNAVTFEIAKQLKSEIGRIFIVDSPPPYFNELSKMKKWLNWVVTFNLPKLWTAFNNYFKYVKLREPSDEHERNLFLTGKHLHKIMSTYKWSPQHLEIVLIRSSQNNEDKYHDYHILNWQMLAKGGLQTKAIESDHRGIFKDQAAVEMATIIDDILNVYDN